VFITKFKEVSMLAYFLDTSGQGSLREMENPLPTQDNAIIKIERTSICGTDFRFFMTGKTKVTPPLILGHECVGTIVHTGDLAKGLGLEEGMRVTVAPAIGCGDCWICESGHTNMCDSLATIGFEYNGTFAEYMEIPKHVLEVGNVIPLPDKVDFDNAVLVEPAACALNAQAYLDIKSGDVVVIYGSGFIGCIHAELAFLAGASRVIMVEIAAPRREIALKMVPEIEMIDPLETNTKEKIMELTNGRGANVVITALSVPEIHTEALEVASKMGRISLFGGLPGDGKGYLDSNLIHYKELCVYGAHATPVSMMETLLERIGNGELDFKKYISKKIPLKDINEGFIALRDDHAMKVVLTNQ
jgi:L-iditol 2-dehydrogenase